MDFVNEFRCFVGNGLVIRDVEFFEENWVFIFKVILFLCKELVVYMIEVIVSEIIKFIVFIDIEVMDVFGVVFLIRGFIEIVLE